MCPKTLVYAIFHHYLSINAKQNFTEKGGMSLSILNMTVPVLKKELMGLVFIRN